MLFTACSHAQVESVANARDIRTPNPHPACRVGLGLSSALSICGPDLVISRNSWNLSRLASTKLDCAFFSGEPRPLHQFFPEPLTPPPQQRTIVLRGSRIRGFSFSSIMVRNRSLPASRLVPALYFFLSLRYPSGCSSSGQGRVHPINTNGATPQFRGDRSFSTL